MLIKSIVLISSLILNTSCLAAEEKIKSKVAYDVNDLLEVEKQTIHAYHEVVPSVVNVSNIKIGRDFYYGEVEVPQGSGTGFVWDKQGHIVTNFHVVQGGNSFVINFHNDQKQYKAKVVGVAPAKDIAVLKVVSAPKSLLPIIQGESNNLMVGQIAMALGNPFGLDHSLSKGIISALGRKIDGIGGFKIYDMIQTDAAINQGNSGGPLLNSKGRLIGMNTMIFSTSGSSSGLGFAVPVDTIKRIVPQLIKHGKVIRPALGVNILETKVRERYFKQKKGAMLSVVEPRRAAGKAGLKGLERDRYGRMYAGDIILSIEGQEVNSKDDVYHALDKFKIGQKIKVKILRGKKTKEVTVTLEEL